MMEGQKYNPYVHVLIVTKYEVSPDGHMRHIWKKCSKKK
jgi:hypothetical protein